MNADSVGAFGCPLADTTPSIDALAKQGLRFLHAHVQVGNCVPSRNVMWSGRYPHNSGVEGFYPVPDPDYPVLVDLVKQAGYFTAIYHKVSHSTPYHPYDWDLVLGTLPDGTQRPREGSRLLWHLHYPGDSRLPTKRASRSV
jgi:N-sulfoglucosamine sulfohydrolase